MNWRTKFQSWVLERGRAYYLTSRVRELSYENDIYTAKVLGKTLYTAKIQIHNDRLIAMGCSCPHARAGQKCKHMAAVLYEIEAHGEEVKRKQQERSDRSVQPFLEKKEGSGHYQYYDMTRMTKDLQFSEQEFAAGKRLAAEKKVVLNRVDIRCRHGIAYGCYEDGFYPMQIAITFDRNRIIRAECGVSGCRGDYDSNYYYGYKFLCSHILALLILLDEYLKKYNPGDSTDRSAERMFQSFREQHFQRVIINREAQAQDLAFEPVLERDNRAFYLGFKAGTGKLFVVKNLSEFVASYEGKAVVRFGTKTEIDLAKHRMNDTSRVFYEYVYSLVKNEWEREEHARMTYHYYEGENIKNKIELYGERLDKLFELLEGKQVAYTEKRCGRSYKSSLKFRTGKPTVKAEVKKDVDEENVFHGVQVSGEIPEIIRGGEYLYYFTDDSFCRVEQEMSHALEPILQLEENGKFAFSVGRNHLSEFYHQVLPMLKQYVQVEEAETEIIQKYIPPEAKFVFYLDAENDNITCKPMVHYGEWKVSLLDHLKKDHVYESFRNRNQEEEILYQLYDWFPETDAEEEELHCGKSEELILRMLDGGVERLMALGEVHTTDRFRSMNIRKKTNIKVGVSIESDLMNLTISSDDIDREELLEILKSYRRKKKYYRLKSGDFVSINDTDLEMLGSLLETLHISPKEFVKDHMKIPVYRALYLSKMLEQSEEIYLNRDKHFKNLVKEFKTLEDSEFEVPDSLKSVMRKYQIQGFQWLKTLEHYGFGGILADDMGLGKTLQMISVLQSAKEKGELGTTLIVSPASLVYNWKEEFRRFAPDLKVTLVVGNQQERANIIRDYENSDVLVTSYDLLKRDITEYEDAEFSYQVLDEAQYIKNHSTAAAKSVKVIKSKHRYALTGTPIENRLSELWSIFDYLMPGYLYGYESFRKELETPIVKHQEEAVSQRLKKMVSPFILRRLKGDVLKDLPDKMEEIRYAKLESEQQKLYDGQVVHMQQIIAGQNSEDFQKNKLQILAELTKIRQICCDPELLFEKYQGESAKRTACMELIQSAIEGEHKILVFSQFTSMLELLERDLQKQKIGYFKITGATGKEKRLEMVNAFNRDATPVFLISLKAGGTGLNLTGADVVIHYDPWWNQAAQNQATDRAHRIGQEKIVTVYKLIAKDTIEEKIVKMQETKRDLADSILSGENGSITQMGKEELLELLEG